MRMHPYGCECNDCQTDRFDRLEKLGKTPKFSIGDLVEIRWAKRAGSKFVYRINRVKLGKGGGWSTSQFNYVISNNMIINEDDLVLHVEKVLRKHG